MNPKQYAFKEETHVPITEFNAGIAKLMRIDRLKVESHKSRLQNDMMMWLRCLQGFESEIYEKCNKDEIKILDENRILLKEKMNDWRSQIKMSELGNNLVKDDFYYALDNYEKMLSKIEKKYGFGMPDREHASSAVSK